MLTLRMAWRNLWRNRRRSLVTLLTVSSCTVILILSWALVKGITTQYQRNITNLTAGEAQMHAADYRKEQDFWNTLDDVDGVLAWADSRGVTACPRSYGFGLGASGSKSAGTQFQGVRPALETAAFDLHDHMERGSYLEAGERGGVVLGKKLALSLDVDVGDELIAVVQCADGSLGNELYTVKGILKTVGQRIDRSAAILDMEDFAELFVADGMLHEIAFNSHGEIEPEKLAEEIAQRFHGAETLSWQELFPTMSDFISIAEAMTVLFLAIYCVAAAVGVLNTQLMATFDRMREFGVIKALGTPPWRIVRDVAAEAALLGLLGIVAGVLLAWPFYRLLNVYGIDTSTFTDGSMSFSGVAFDPLWRAYIGPREVLLSALMMWSFCVIASIWPAVLAARLDPVAAIRHRR